jgi:choline dehydrogenase-like flavoprotein
MFLDLRQIPDGTALEADLCIVGAGAAGITIARQFIGRPITVLVVESGGLEPDEATQALYQGAIVGQPYFDLDVTRLRYFGGSTNHWGGWCAPLHDIDFEARDWVPHSGWPIARHDLEPYYAAAQLLVEIGPPTYDPLVWQDDKHRFPAFQPERVVRRSSSSRSLQHISASAIATTCQGRQRPRAAQRPTRSASATRPQQTRAACGWRHSPAYAPASAPRPSSSPAAGSDRRACCFPTM